MDPKNASQAHLVGATAVACLRCRRLKMRCQGSENPPCVRCAKGARQCVVPQSKRYSQSHSGLAWQDQGEGLAGYGHVQSSTATGVDAESPAQLHQRTSSNRNYHSTFNVLRHQSVSLASVPEASTTAPVFLPAGQPASRDGDFRKDLLSIYSTSPISAFDQRKDSPKSSRHFTTEDDTESQSSPKRRRLSSSASLNNLAQSIDAFDANVNEQESLNDQHLLQLAHLFKEHILRYVPVIEEEDIQDTSNLLTKQRPLLYCIAFVTARFVPGCKSLRKILVPHVLGVLRRRFHSSHSDERETWALLQAFAVLHAYRQVDNTVSEYGEPFQNEDLSHWALKASIETLALRLALHREVEEVERSIRSNRPNICNTLSYRRYIFWLWLFTMAHKHSLVIRTPPTIREDSTIQYAATLRMSLDNSKPVLGILAEVDLCLLWEQAGLRERGLGEWWCPLRSNDTYDNMAVLEDVDAALRVWSERWGIADGSPNSSHLSGSVDFHYRFTRFCISTYATRNIPHPSISSTGVLNGSPSSYPSISQNQAQSLFKSVSAASSCCDMMLELSPLAKDALRYVADFGFVMLSFCCLYVIQACELFGLPYPALNKHLDKVELAAQLMLELATNSRRSPALYGEWILNRVKNSRSSGGINIPRDSARNGLSESASSHQPSTHTQDIGSDDLVTRNRHGREHHLDFIHEILPFQQDDHGSSSTVQDMLSEHGSDSMFAIESNWDFSTFWSV